jgi:hypothetical protein
MALIDLHLRDGMTGLDLAAELAEAGVMNWSVADNSHLCRTHTRYALGCVQKPYRRESIFAALEVSKALKAGKSFPESVSEGVVLYPPDRVDARASQ